MHELRARFLLGMLRHLISGMVGALGWLYICSVRMHTQFTWDICPLVQSDPFLVLKGEGSSESWRLPAFNAGYFRQVGVNKCFTPLHYVGRDHP